MTVRIGATVTPTYGNHELGGYSDHYKLDVTASEHADASLGGVSLPELYHKNNPIGTFYAEIVVSKFLLFGVNLMIDSETKTYEYEMHSLGSWEAGADDDVVYIADSKIEEPFLKLAYKMGAVLHEKKDNGMVEASISAHYFLPYNIKHEYSLAKINYPGTTGATMTREVLFDKSYDINVKRAGLLMEEQSR